MVRQAPLKSPLRRKTVKRSKKFIIENFLDFLTTASKETDEQTQEELIQSFVNAVVTSELLGIPHDGGKLLPEQEPIRESMAREFTKFIRSVLKHRLELKVERANHFRHDPIIPMVYPKKEYKTKYIIKG